MISAFEAHVRLMTHLNDPTYESRVDATLYRVIASCHADGLPDWLIALVILRTKDEIMVGSWPLLSAEEASQ